MCKRCLSLGCSLGLLALLLTFPVRSHADTIYSNLGPGNSYSAGVYWTVAGPSVFGSTVVSAMPFVSTGDFDLGQILIALSYFSGTNGAIVTLNSDNGGVPGAVIESWSVAGLPDINSASTTVQTLTSSQGVLLFSGTSYWLVASPLASDTFAAWNLNSTGASGIVEQFSGGTWNSWPSQPLGAFAVMGTPTAAPEPSTFILLGCGLVGLLLIRRIRSVQRQT